MDSQISEQYARLLHLLEKRHLATFKSIMRRRVKEAAAWSSAIDPNHRLPYPVLMSLLDKAASDNLPEFVEFLLEMGADPNALNQDRDRAPIHFAAEAGHAAALSALLKSRGLRLNLLAGGLTAMHFAVKAESEECARLLLKAGASPNLPNPRGQTALHFAADKSKRKMVELILASGQVLELDAYRDHKNETARMIIQRKFPDIALPASSTPVDHESLLRYYITANDETNFLKVLANAEDIHIVKNKGELLKMAVERNLRDATRALLKADSSTDSESLLELGKIAIERAHPDILHELLSANYKLANRLLLPASQELGISIKPATKSRDDRIKCFGMILSQDGVDVHQEDDKGNSPLHYAARAECKEALELLLKKGCHIGHVNNFGVPPLVHIPLSILKNHLDDCLTSCNEGTEEHEIIMDYKNFVPNCSEVACDDDKEYFLEPPLKPLDGNKPSREADTLLYIANQKHLKHLLKHPLLTSFLYLKYSRIRHILYVNFIFYLVFFVLLNLYIWLMTSSTLKGEVPPSDVEVYSAVENWKNRPTLSVLLGIFSIFMLVRESLQFVSSPLYYIGNPENWFEILLICLTFVLLSGGSSEVGAVAILLSSWELVILMAQHPRMSIDIEMFKTVTINFTKFLLLYVFLILAFAFSFFVLFKDNENFPNPFNSLFKTIVMITGEFDASSLPFINYPVLSRLIFIGFIFLVVIILLNLLNGLAVNDTAEILAEAELVCLIARTRMVAYVERLVVGSSFFPRIKLCCCMNFPLIRSLTTAPLHFMARKILLFPRYLPRARISIKPLKSLEMKLHGRAESQNRCSTLKIDPLVIQRAKGIIAARGKQSSEEKILTEIMKLEKKFGQLETHLREIKDIVIGNKRRTSEEALNK